MDFIRFPEANRALGAPAGMSPDECGTLHVYADGRQCVSCWQPTQQEREAIAAGLPIYLGVLVSSDPAQPAYTQPPVFVTVGKPEMPPVGLPMPSQKYLEALAYIAKLLPDPATVAEGLREGAELAAAWPALRSPDGGRLDPDKQYYVGGVATQAEHYAALVEAYQKAGQAGVVAYLQPYEAFLPKEIFTV